MTRPRIDRMRERLTTSLQPQMLDIEDESHLHVGHAGARDGRGHFRVIIVADAFEGLTRVQRHQRIYAALGDLMQTDIHALAVQALTPAEL
jgi:BolA protein